ncbi:hypothetical protein [Thermomonas sp.]|uniref:hypothetical protein n=1 Tax=Thermomonas sp. TaxID=1971895 RepID=UPI00391C395A
MGKVIYLPQADRCCTRCGETKGISNAAARMLVRVDVRVLFERNAPCPHCEDLIVLPDLPEPAPPTEDRVCHDCGCSAPQEDLVSAQIIDDILGGRREVLICGDCLAATDEGANDDGGGDA